MDTRTIEISFSKSDGSGSEEMDCGDDTVTLYARYNPKREFVVLPDVCGFRLHVGKPGSISPFVCIDFEDDGRIIIRWNDGSGNFKVSRPLEGTVLIMPVPGKEKP